MTALYVGLMSGTSMDGIDVALVDFCTNTPHLVASLSQPFSLALQQQLLDSRTIPDSEVFNLDQLDIALGEAFAAAVNNLLEIENVDRDEVVAIGSHGQTIRHRPHADKPFSLQLGNANRIAELTGIQVVSDFRTADIDAGGEGAPLAPAFHNAILRDNSENRCVVNIGGIANITLLPADSDDDISGYDTGPGNTLMDAWVRRHQQQSYDKAGSWARSGKVNKALLQLMLDDEYFHKLQPKSTGFEDFNMRWLEHILSRLDTRISAEDVEATLCELTAQTIADAVKACEPAVDRVLLCGGGVHNTYLVERIQHHLGTCPVQSTESYGAHPDWVEAIAFAWLARRCIDKKPGNLPAVTGARAAVVLGRITYHRAITD